MLSYQLAVQTKWEIFFWATFVGDATTCARGILHGLVCAATAGTSPEQVGLMPLAIPGRSAATHCPRCTEPSSPWSIAYRRL